MGRKVHTDGTALIWGPNGAIVVTQPVRGVLYVIGLGNFDGPFEDGPMCDFDRVIAEHGSLDLFLDMRGVDRGSRKSRGPWKEWASKHSAQHKSFVLVRSSLLHMAISVIAMASNTVTQCYSNENVFLSELMRKAPNVTGLPVVPGWAKTILQSSQNPPPLDSPS